MSALSPIAAYAAALGGETVAVRFAGSRAEPLPLATWLGETTPADEAVLDRARGPVLDVGCGPGRHVRALAERGVLAIGIDLSPDAADLARARGASVFTGCVFGWVPGTGTWGSVLLLDGNVGIGGDPVLLLDRLRALLRAGGEVLAEFEAPGAGTARPVARLEAQDESSEWFPWARVGADAAPALAEAAGFALTETWADGERRFARLRRP